MISCIIPVYNNAAFLREAVESVMASTKEIEILIIEDGSQDDSALIAKQLADTFTQVKLFSHGSGVNKGAAASRNLGIEKATGEYICFLDSDDFFYPHRFEKCLKILHSQRDIDAVYGACEIVSCDSSNTLGAQGDFFGLHEDIPADSLLEKLLQGVPWSMSTITVRREFFTRCGLFPEGVKIAEDCNLWFRMAALGKLIAGEVTRPVSAYRRHENNTFRPGIEHKVSMIEAMLDVCSWAKGKKLNKGALQTLKKGTETYILNSLVEARKQKRPDVIKMIRQRLVRTRAFGLLSKPAIAKQFLHSAFKSEAG